MVSVNSTMLALGTRAPDFTLPDPRGQLWRLEEHAADRPVLVAFICNHCPYVKHIGHELARATRRWLDIGVGVVGINSNDVDTHPDDAPDKMLMTAAEYAWPFPYLIDDDQSVARAYRAACTPDFFLFDDGHRLVYRGQFDDSRPRSDVPVTGADLEAAVQAVREGREPPADQRPSMGCNIKWKPGNEPDYFG